MLLMTSNIRSGGVGQGRASFVRRASGRSEAQSLDGRRSGGYSASDAQALCFLMVPLQELQGCCRATCQTRFSTNCLIP